MSQTCKTKKINQVGCGETIDQQAVVVIYKRLLTTAKAALPPVAITEAAVATAEATVAAEAGVEVTAGTAVLVVSVATEAALAAKASAGRAGGLGLLLLVSLGDNLLRQVKELTEVGDALLGEVPVVPLPVEGLANVAAGLEGGHELDNLEVRHVDGLMLGLDIVLGGDNDTLCELQEYTITSTRSKVSQPVQILRFSPLL
mmetsp:Transcript_1896/g.3544  ORF Transcript_1896/g.3544 Transcript_1896/m.3544 type:complete len:201 (+) Transcript_1896:382-984(+)|eukprot:CAMPEP_0171491732 /NCGR_PEP_ID=MMETSP0958-20121227/4018_1 /TAXON_ID=87120 /ORGANISM="Aurantiochytrium limacinum, Strain ATCCMYA-1381" /LENGTH=200 /DNA_ID=CAMNT_0012025173 /DNA_START=652 /DNA_END=1254 /DNA_ORIENTATION=+